MKLGFTGTRNGMTFDQKQKFIDLIFEYYNEIREFHHGDCIGSDEEADHLIRFYLNKEGVEIVLHPPKASGMRAWCDRREGNNSIELPLKYLARNKKIVEASDFIIAIPNSFDEQVRSGTWSTIRYARRLEKPTVVIYPDGTAVY